MVLGALAALLETESDIEVIGRARMAAKPASWSSDCARTSSSPTSRCR